MEAIVCAGWVAESVRKANRGPLKMRADLKPLPAPDPSTVRPMMSQGLGVLRDGNVIERLVRSLAPIANSHGSASDPALVGLMIAVSACRREESRGGHYRADFPNTLPEATPSSISLADAVDAAGEIIESEALSLGSAQP
jgi:L-aspartate oxidase